MIFSLILLFFRSVLRVFILVFLKPEDKKLTARQFHTYRIMKHGNSFNILHKCKRLFQQYLVDMWAKIKGTRLNYVQFNQGKLRADLYKRLQDAINEYDAERAGKRVILPGSFMGGQRFMIKHYQDAMAIVRHFG